MSQTFKETLLEVFSHLSDEDVAKLESMTLTKRQLKKYIPTFQALKKTREEYRAKHGITNTTNLEDTEEPEYPEMDSLEFDLPETNY